MAEFRAKARVLRIANVREIKDFAFAGKYAFSFVSVHRT